MWREYSLQYLKKNKSAAIGIAVAVGIASMFLTFVTCIFYGMWEDSVEQILEDEGGYHAELTGSFSQEDLDRIETFPQVREAVVKEAGRTADTGEQIYTVQVELANPKKVYEEIPLLAGQVGLDAENPEEVSYHWTLLVLYLIFSPSEQQNPPAVFLVYILVMLVVTGSLLLIIYHAFAVTGSARMHQLGILQSVGATPGQLRRVFLGEAALLGLPAVLLGMLAGSVLNYGFLRLAGELTAQVGWEMEEQYLRFTFPLPAAAASFTACVLTLFLSAWISARKLGRITPLQALRQGEERPVGRMKRFRLLSFLFGAEGELAAKSLYARRKAFRTATLSLTLSMLGFTVFLNFLTLSEISVREVSYERYRNVWDLRLEMRTAGDTDMQARLRELPGVFSCTAEKQEDGEYHYQIRTESLAAADALEEPVSRLAEAAGGSYTLVNRVRQMEYNERAYDAQQLLFGSLCWMLACIGFANVFANMLGQISLRRREFARYQSVGMTPGGVWKVLGLEALLLAGRPVLIALPVNLLFVWFLTDYASVSRSTFLREAPLPAMLLFAALFFAAAGTAAFLGGRRILKENMTEGLRDETLF